MLETMKKWAVLLCTVVMLGTTLAAGAAAPAAAVPAYSGCFEFTVQSPVVQDVQWQGFHYVLLENGGVWVPCGPTWYGDASNGTTGRQPYFNGRNARNLELCIRNWDGGGSGNVVGYRIIATSGEAYMYGANTNCAYLRNLGYVGCAKFMPQRSIVHVTGHNVDRGPWYLLSGGGVWAPCGGFFGDASNGTTGSKSYFIGRKASTLELCHMANHNIVGYRIRATSGEYYMYGTTPYNSGDYPDCAYITGNGGEWGVNF